MAYSHMFYMIRHFSAICIAFMPFNSLRCFFYKRFGYNISLSRIGWGTVIAINKLEMCNAMIGRYNKIIGPFTIEMKKKSAIGSNNNIVCGLWAIDKDHERFNYQRTLILEEGSTITSHHWLDVVDLIRIGKESYIAGIGSQFWTHGFSSDQRDINIGIDCYIGSSCIFTPGSGVQDKTIVGAGSVITKKHTQRFCLLSGNPASIIRENYYWRSRSFVDPN